MARRIISALPALVALTLPGTASAAEAPVAVSPGDAAEIALVEDRCPTFSWGEMEGATSYELVAYRVGDEGEATQPMLQRSFPGSVSSWTPALDQCLERGGRYGWSVRAVNEKGASKWSAPNLFEVAAGPSEVELEAALEIVEQYLRAAGVDAVVGTAETTVTQTAAPGASQTAGSSSALAPAPGDSRLRVNGAPVVTTATLAAAIVAINRECPGALTSSDRYTDCLNGTVRDNNTGLFWLKDASCSALAGTDPSGQGNWNTAEAAAAALASGTCGLTDGSSPGDWRQPTILELCSASTGSAPFPCPGSAALDSLVDSTAGPPTIAVGHPFVGVQSSNYWSANLFDAVGAWVVNLGNGSVQIFGEFSTADGFMWPVRGGQ